MTNPSINLGKTDGDTLGRDVDHPGPPAGPQPSLLLTDLPVVLIAIGSALLWALVLLVLYGLVTGLIPTPAALFPMLGPDSPLRWAIFAQISVLMLIMSATLVLGTVGAALYFAGQLGRAARSLRILLWTLLAVTVVGPVVAAGPSLAMSGSFSAMLPAMITSLPMMPVHVAMLLIADRALARASADI